MKKFRFYWKCELCKEYMKDETPYTQKEADKILFAILHGIHDPAHPIQKLSTHACVDDDYLDTSEGRGFATLLGYKIWREKSDTGDNQ